MFRVVRNLTKLFEGSNPTWVKRALHDGQRVDVSKEEIDLRFELEFSRVLETLESSPAQLGSRSIATASSGSLPLADSSIDVVLTSPPYLTRIDYAVAYSRELAVLGVDAFAKNTVRLDLMGTTLTRPKQDSIGRMGETAESLLRSISKHESKASRSYYYKQAAQYLLDLTAGFDEISRVTRPDATFVIVVQDSYYKDVHVPLAQICREEVELRGWTLVGQEATPVRRSLISINRPASSYAKSAVYETVLTFKS